MGKIHAPEADAWAWVVVECQQGQTERTRVDGGRVTRVRALPAGVAYPYNYGYAEDTLAPDGEPMDVFVVGPPQPPLARVRAQVVAGLSFFDARGEDAKLLAVAEGEPLPGPQELARIQAQVADFLRRYKDPGQRHAVGSWVDGQEAVEWLRECRQRQIRAGARPPR